MASQSLDLRDINLFADASSVSDWLKGGDPPGTEPMGLAEIRLSQRLLRLCPRSESAEGALMTTDERSLVDGLRACGFECAQSIADLTEEEFLKCCQEHALSADANLETVYQNAVDVSERVALLWAHVKDAVASPHYQATLFHNDSEALTELLRSLPGYTDLFGSLDYCACEHCQSILSPAAYLVNLMGLIEKEVTGRNKDTIPEGWKLKDRRPDLWQIPLDCHHTETMVPQLEILNGIMAARLKAEFMKKGEPQKDVQQQLACAPYPFHLPYNPPLAGIRAYLDHFKRPLSTLYETFKAEEPAIWREQLELLPEDVTLLTKTDADLKVVYGLGDTETPVESLRTISRFLQQSDLDRNQLQDLLVQGLSPAERAADDGKLPHEFYINQSFVVSRYLRLIRPSLLFGEGSRVTIDRDGVDSPLNNLTLEVWVKWNGNVAEDIQAIVHNGAFHEDGYGLYVNKGKIAILCGNVNFLVSQQELRKAQWTHIAAVRKADFWTLYVDGEPYPVAFNNATPITPTQDIYLGSDDVNQHFHGQLAEVRFWKIPRTQDQIRTHRNLRIVDPQDLNNLVGYWRLDEGSGTDARDSSGEPSHDGTITEPKWQLEGFPSTEIVNLTDRALDRLHRFIRLAQRLGWSYADLDWVLQSIAAKEINIESLEAIARINMLQAQLKLPLDVLCSFWADLKTTGVGANPHTTEALFDRVFNQPTSFDSNPGQLYHPKYDHNPLYDQEFLDWDPGNESDPKHRHYRARLSASLKLNDAGLDLLASLQFTTITITLSVENLSFFYRYSKLASSLSLEVAELVILLQLLNLVEENGGTFRLKSTLQPAQLGALVKATRWLKQAGLSVYQLAFLLDGKIHPTVDIGYAPGDVPALLEGLRKDSGSWQLQSNAFMSGAIDAEQSAEAFRALKAESFINEAGVVIKSRQEVGYQQLVESLLVKPPHSAKALTLRFFTDFSGCPGFWLGIAVTLGA